MTDRYERALNVIASSVPTPEDELIAREEAEEHRRDRSGHPDRHLLKRLCPADRELLRMSLGQGLSTWKIGALKRVSHQAVQKRLQAIRRRLAWIKGPGRLFTAIDVWRHLRWRLMPDDTRMLVLYWQRRNTREVARAVRRTVPEVRRRLTELVAVDLMRLTDEDAERYGRFLRGYRLLLAQLAGEGVLANERIPQIG